MFNCIFNICIDKEKNPMVITRGVWQRDFLSPELVTIIQKFLDIFSQKAKKLIEKRQRFYWGIKNRLREMKTKRVQSLSNNQDARQANIEKNSTNYVNLHQWCTSTHTSWLDY